MFLSNVVVYIIFPILCLWTFRNTFVGICTYYFWSLYRPQDIYFYSIGVTGIRFTRIIAIVTLISFIIHHRRYINFFRNLWYPLQNRLMLLYLFLTWVAQWVSINPIFSKYPTIIITKLVLMYFLLTATVFDKKHFKIMLYIFATSFVLLAIWAHQKYYIDRYWDLEYPLSLTTTYKDRNGFAMLFVVLLPFCVLFPFSLKKFLLKLLWFLGGILAANTVFLTASRGGFLGVFISSITSITKIKRREYWYLF